MWFKNFFENIGFEVLISGTRTTLTNIDLAKKADIVIVSVPIQKTIEVIKEVRKNVKKNALLCDFTSLKSKQVDAIKKADSGVLGIHPLFGPMVQSLDGQKFAFCKVKDNHWVNFLKKLFIQNGADVIEVSPKEHDLQMADDFKKIAQIQSTKILQLIDKQPIKIVSIKKPVDFTKQSMVGFLGPKGTFSHQATLKIFTQKPQCVEAKTITEIFEKVNSHEIDIGIVPIKNTIGGIVAETINCLINYPVKVSGSFNMEIHQCLLSRIKNKKNIQFIKSHPQALSQCNNWLAKNLPQTKTEATASTTVPILNSTDKTTGFIASEIAAKIYGLNILAKNIETNTDNLTKFYLITPEINKILQKKLQANKTLILLAVHDKVGVLQDILDIFAKNNINLTALHSVPSLLRQWDYFFFLEIETPYPSLKTKKVLKELEKYCSMVRVLGVS